MTELMTVKEFEVLVWHCPVTISDTMTLCAAYRAALERNAELEKRAPNELVDAFVKASDKITGGADISTWHDYYEVRSALVNREEAEDDKSS